MRFKNKSVVITGGGSGIGRACAKAFAAEGANVVIADIDFERATQTVEQIGKSEGAVFAVQTDVAHPASVSSLVNDVIKRLASIHTLVNNAAIQVNKTISDTGFEEWNRQLAVNLTGAFLCSRNFLPLLRKTKGSIINMSSVNAFFAEPSCAGYCATKAAIVGLTKAMAIDHGHEGIRANCICPGYIDAGLAEGYFQSQADPGRARLEAGSLHALGRIGRAEEVAKAALFLASDEALFCTGAVFTVDGGFSSGLPAKRHP